MADGLYIHVPFCARRCGYCDFYSSVGDADAMRTFVDALLIELQAVTGPIETIFVGGGTPSILPSDVLCTLFEPLARIARRDQPIEFTVEVNPASLSDDKAAVLRDCGVKRISMGVQSFNDKELRTLERIHAAAEIAPSVEIIQRHGFEHMNLDLIFGVPGQTIESWRASLDEAARLGADHLSCYGLTYEPGTKLYNDREKSLVLPMDEELEATLYEFTMDHLPTLGFEQYEISNYAKPGGQSQHNLRYWHNQPVIGVGPSAASYVEGKRYRNVPDVARYVECINAGKSAVIDEEQLSPNARAGETAMLMLRMNRGIDRTFFEDATGFDASELFANVIQQRQADGTIEVDDRSIRLTRSGRLIADTVMTDFLSPGI